MPLTTDHQGNIEALLSNDKALTTPDKDYLSNYQYAKKMLEAIQFAPKQGFVAAIKASWGMGKSSLLNFIKLESRNYQNIKIVEFNPWWFSGSGELTVPFFMTLSSEIEKHGDKELKIKEKIGKFGDFLAGFGETMKGGGGAAVKHIGKSIKSLFGIDIATIKEEISKELENGNFKYLVIVDDIDRLERTEILSLFKLIKGIADFPNVLYLLSFDEEIVIHAIQKELEISGKAYLEKIVQFSFHLPIPDSETLFQELTRRIDLLCTKHSVHFDKYYWKKTFRRGILQTIRSPRDINRFLNAITITFPTVCNDVNPVDFFAIETIRIFFPEVYYYIQTNPHQFLVSEYTRELLLIQSKNNHSETSGKHQGWIDLLPKTEQPHLISLVAEIFPKVAIEINKVDNKKNNWRKEKFICSSEYFRTYFNLSIPVGKLSSIQLKQIIKATNTVDEVKALIERLINEEQISFPHLLLGFADIKENLSTAQSEVLAVGISKMSNVLLKAPELTLDLIYADALQSMTDCLINLTADSENQLKVLNAIIQNASSLALKISIYSYVELKTDRDHQIGIRKKILAEVVKAVKNDDFFFTMGVDTILKFWQLNDSSRFQTFLKKHLSNEKKIVLLIESLITPIRTDSEKVEYYLNESFLDELFGAEINWKEFLKRIWISKPSLLKNGVSKVCEKYFK